VNVTVRPATPSDAAAWLRMRTALWPDGAGDHAGEIARFLAGTARAPQAVLIAVDSSDEPLGFVELFIRNYAEGCLTDRIAYLEGWYVVPEGRRQGVGRALVAAAEAWAESEGCTEFGSDAALDNDVSAAVHRAVGFRETARIRCFRKTLLRSAAT
jgi:aminoglycoside 6'-N-acetyltransferase I